MGWEPLDRIVFSLMTMMIVLSIVFGTTKITDKLDNVCGHVVESTQPPR